MEAPFEGGKGPEGAAAPWMDPELNMVPECSDFHACGSWKYLK